MTIIDDLIYSPIPVTEPPQGRNARPIEEVGKTFKDLCDQARDRKKNIEDEFKHLRGKLFTRENLDGSVDIVHKDLAG